LFGQRRGRGGGLSFIRRPLRGLAPFRRPWSVDDVWMPSDGHKHAREPSARREDRSGAREQSSVVFGHRTYACFRFSFSSCFRPSKRAREIAHAPRPRKRAGSSSVVHSA
ncbi:unnamed protein product, partial [Scytosiphon promiscuus]